LKDLDSTITPLPTLPFEGIDIPVPHNALDIARRHYGADVMTYMHYSDVTNGFGHSEMIFELARLERHIDLFGTFTYATGLDVTTDAERDYQLNVSGVLTSHLLRVCESEYPDTKSIDRALTAIRDDWLAFLTKRALRLFIVS